MVSLRWLQWFQLVGARVQAVTREAVAYDPPIIGAGTFLTVNVTYEGATPADYVTAVSFDPMTEGGIATSFMRVTGNVTAAGVVSVTFANMSGGAIDLDPGTIRIQVERAT